MTHPLKKSFPTIALMLTCSLASLGLGVVIGQQAGATSQEPQSNSTVKALSTDGATVYLAADEAQTFEENSQPLAPEDATYESNMDLTETEAVQRSEEVGASYHLGESVTPEDLEFLRIYAFSAEETAPSSGSEPTVTTALASTDGGSVKTAMTNEGPNIVLVDDVWTTSFNKSATHYGTTGNIAGSAKAVTGTLISNSWAVNWTAKRTAGYSTTKINSKADIYAYGATGAWPFIGLVYSAHPSASTTNQSLGFSRAANYTALTAYVTVDCTSTFYNRSGSFQIVAHGF
jgi:hypothetical protein